MRRKTANRLTHDFDRAGRSLAAIGNAANQRGLAGTIRTDETDEFAAACREADIGKNRKAAEVLADARNFDRHLIMGARL